MKKALLILVSSITSLTSFSQFSHPTVGINGEYVGSCLVATCGPATYTDNGGILGNYSNNINNIYRVFCPNTAGQCMRVTFTSFNVEGGYDYLLVGNGPTQNSPVFTTPPASPTFYTGVTGLTGNLGGSVPFSYTSTDASGCLTFRFRSDFTVNRSGWVATLNCVPCAGGPNGTDNNDCNNMTPLCSSASVGGNATGPGIAAEGCTGTACPAGGENHTNWYTFTAQTTGTLNINIVPTDPLDDYDFAIYGPNVSCGALGAPIRCTDSGVQGNTGMNGSAGDNTEDVTGDSFLQTMNVTAGQNYILVVDEWSPNAGSGYTLNFSGTASLDCNILPVELSRFDIDYASDQGVVDIVWETESERDNDYFVVERSTDGEYYEEIARVKGTGNSNTLSQYFSVDENPFVGTNYYRIKQVDVSGGENYTETKSINILDDFYDLLSVNPNPTNDRTEIVFNAYGNENADLKIYSMSGKLIEHASISCTKGGNRMEIDLSNEEDGIYMLTLSTNNKTYTAKLVKQ